VKACDAKTVEALKLARDRIETFHKKQMPKDERFTDPIGRAYSFTVKHTF